MVTSIRVNVLWTRIAILPGCGIKTWWKVVQILIFHLLYLFCCSIILTATLALSTLVPSSEIADRTVRLLEIALKRIFVIIKGSNLPVAPQPSLLQRSVPLQQRWHVTMLDLDPRLDLDTFMADFLLGEVHIYHNRHCIWICYFIIELMQSLIDK